MNTRLDDTKEYKYSVGLTAQDSTSMGLLTAHLKNSDTTLGDVNVYIEFENYIPQRRISSKNEKTQPYKTTEGEVVKINGICQVAQLQGINLGSFHQDQMNELLTSVVGNFAQPLNQKRYEEAEDSLGLAKAEDEVRAEEYDTLVLNTNFNFHEQIKRMADSGVSNINLNDSSAASLKLAQSVSEGTGMVVSFEAEDKKLKSYVIDQEFHERFYQEGAYQSEPSLQGRELVKSLQQNSPAIRFQEVYEDINKSFGTTIMVARAATRFKGGIANHELHEHNIETADNDSVASSKLDDSSSVASSGIDDSSSVASSGIDDSSSVVSSGIDESDDDYQGDLRQGTTDISHNSNSHILNAENLAIVVKRAEEEIKKSINNNTISEPDQLSFGASMESVNLRVDSDLSSSTSAIARESEPSSPVSGQSRQSLRELRRSIPQETIGIDAIPESRQSPYNQLQSRKPIDIDAVVKEAQQQVAVQQEKQVGTGVSVERAPLGKVKVHRILATSANPSSSATAPPIGKRLNNPAVDNQAPAQKVKELKEMFARVDSKKNSEQQSTPESSAVTLPSIKPK